MFEVNKVEITFTRFIRAELLTELEVLIRFEFGVINNKIDEMRDANLS